MWRRLLDLVRRDHDDRPSYPSAGYSSAPTKEEERLDEAIISLAIGKMALSLIDRGGSPYQREVIQGMIDKMDAMRKQLLAEGVEPAKPGSERQAKIDWHVSEWKKDQTIDL